MVSVVCVTGTVGVVGVVLAVGVVICGKTNSAISFPILMKFSQCVRNTF